jgi:hypothetical protein
VGAATDIVECTQQEAYSPDDNRTYRGCLCVDLFPLLLTRGHSVVVGHRLRPPPLSVSLPLSVAVQKDVRVSTIPDPFFFSLPDSFFSFSPFFLLWCPFLFWAATRRQRRVGPNLYRFVCPPPAGALMILSSIVFSCSQCPTEVYPKRRERSNEARKRTHSKMEKNRSRQIKLSSKLPIHL